MSSKKKISVIIPNYNNAKYLSDCIESLVRQTYKDTEIIIIDDFSTDNSRDIICTYKEKYLDIIKSIFLNKNLGVSKARHIGITEAKGQYVTTLDADDYYYDDQKIEKELELIRKYKELYDKDIVAFSNIVIERDGTKIVRGNDGNIFQGNILYKIISRDCMIPRDFTFKKSLYDKVGGYDFSFPIYEDWDFKIRMAAKYCFFYTGLNGTVYRKHNSGLSSASIPMHIKYLRLVYKKNIFLVNEKDKKQTDYKFNKYIKILRKSYMDQKQ